MRGKNRTTLVRVIGWVVVVLITLALLELGSAGLYPLVFKKPFSRGGIQLKLSPLAASQPESAGVALSEPRTPKDFRNHILHPYLGFVARPGTYVADWEFSRNGRTAVVNEFGFLGLSPLQPPPKQAATICILGGSFAMNFYLDSKDTLVQELRQRGFFRDREINIVSMAMSGWKQPQQLLALNYFLSLGAKYDAVVNLDGFNELALPLSENVPHGVYPFFPRAWPLYTARLLSDGVILQSAEAIQLRQKAQQQRRFFSSPWFRHSNFCLFLFEVLDRRIQNQMAAATQTLQTLLNQGEPTRSFEKSGPQVPKYAGPDELLEAMAGYWETCSRQMDGLCRTRGATYVHLLQPNQYVPDSKLMSKQERAVAYYEGSDYEYKTAVEKGYSGLVTHGRALRRDGVNFVDLTMMFKDVREAIYEDTCCHVNKRGNDLIAARIAQAIAAGR
jgi:hypothetical protein